MKISSLRWQPLILSLLIGSTVAVLVWSIFGHAGTLESFMPHAHCYLLNPQLIRLHGYSDFAIGLAYVAISATLTYLVVRARREIPFHWMMLAFAVFIVACGGTHFMEVYTLQAPTPPYWLAGELKLVTAFASVATAFLLPPLIPKILRLLEEARLSSERKSALEKAHRELEEAHEKVKQLDQLKTSFFANVSHELRTPITLILGPVNSLIEGAGLRPEQQHDLQLIRRNATLLLKHVNDLLDIARLEAGRMAPQYARFDLVKLARLVGGFFSSSSLRSLDFAVEAPASLMMEGDQEKLQTTLFNLVSNAYKFTPEGGRVRLSVGEAQDDQVLIQVEDSGPGVSAEMRESIFERFNQGDTPTARGGGGTGLGLSIVREFVRLHQGRVWLSEAPGGGALFQILLPRQAPTGTDVLPNGASAQVANPAARTGSDLARATLEFIESGGLTDGTAPPDAPLILVVEDHPEMRQFVVNSLAGEFRIITAINGRVGIEMALAENPDLIVTDLMMPEMSGEELLAKLRAHPRFSTTPVILLTARADNEIKLKLLRDGAQDFVVKPFAAEELVTRVRNQVTTKRVRDTLQGELASQEKNLDRLAKEVTVRARELERAKDSAEAANRAKDQFLAVLSHELRTPLTPALATAMNLEHQEAITPRELRHSLNIIRRNIELEARLIDDLLDLTRIARGKLALNVAIVDAHDAIRHAVEMCQSEILTRRSKLELQLEAPRFHLQADGSRLLQVVWNLLLNAVKFTPEDGHIRVHTSNQQSKLVIEIIDDGIGMAPAILLKIFEPFEQAEQTPGRQQGGLGLGLAVAKGLVEAHGGSITARSDGAGLGSTFTMVFDTIDSPVTDGVSPPPETSPRSSRSMRVLLVEDHDDTRLAMVRLLKLWGHEVHTATTVAEGLALVKSRDFDVLVSDLGLPDGHGTDVMEAMRQHDPACLGIAMSGFGMEEDHRRSAAAGFAEHLTKPVGAQRLKMLLDQYADTHPPKTLGTPAAHSLS